MNSGFPLLMRSLPPLLPNSSDLWIPLGCADALVCVAPRGLAQSIRVLLPIGAGLSLLGSQLARRQFGPMPIWPGVKGLVL